MFPLTYFLLPSSLPHYFFTRSIFPPLLSYVFSYLLTFFAFYFYFSSHLPHCPTFFFFIVSFNSIPPTLLFQVLLPPSFIAQFFISLIGFSFTNFISPSLLFLFFLSAPSFIVLSFFSLIIFSPLI